MYTDIYSAFLQELGRLIDIPDIAPDENESCLIKFNKYGLSIQFELDKSQTNLMMCTMIATLPEESYRNDVLKELLRANDLPPPRYGNFAFYAVTEQVVLWEVFPTKNLRAPEVAHVIEPFLVKAASVKEAIENRVVPSLTPTSSKPKTGIFGLKP